MGVKGFAIAGIVGLIIGFVMVKMGANNIEPKVKTEKEVKSLGIKKITKTKSYHLTRNLNDSTRVFIDSTVWYEDQKMD